MSPLTDFVSVEVFNEIPRGGGLMVRRLPGKLGFVEAAEAWRVPSVGGREMCVRKWVICVGEGV